MNAPSFQFVARNLAPTPRRQKSSNAATYERCVIEPVVITGRRDYGIVGIRSLTSAFRMTYVIAVATRQR